LIKKSWTQNADGSGDKLYWLNGKIYEKLDGASWGAIEAGKAKL
jgi:hypothetical protein